MKKLYFKKASKKKEGYTIIETMIAVSLFLIIVMYGMNTLLNANLLYEKSRNLRSIMDNLSFVMEDMSRNLRIGYNFHCFLPNEAIPFITDPSISQPKSCSSGWAIAFESASGLKSNHDDQWVYYIDNLTGRIFKSTQGPYTASNFVQLTPDEVFIDQIAGFSVLGAESLPGDMQQPLVNIKLAGRITFKNTVTFFSLQTTVSQRLLDV